VGEAGVPLGYDPGALEKEKQRCISQKATRAAVKHPSEGCSYFRK